MSFHTFSFPEDRCVRLLNIVREKLESLNIRVQGVMQPRSGHRDQDPTKDRPPTLTSSYQWRGALRFPRSDLSPSSAVSK
jgi:hypothetical protein